MTAEQVSNFWNATYPEALPISHYFRSYYPTKWFRIHSLPESKRYPDTEEEWIILLNRQNIIITDLMGSNNDVLVVTGEYKVAGFTELELSETIDSASAIPLINLAAVNLHNINRKEYDAGHTLMPMFSKQIWQPGKFDNLLRDIAQYQTSAFFISVENQCLAAPYDGGVDVVLENESARDFYENKYSAWLSASPNGL